MANTEQDLKHMNRKELIELLYAMKLREEELTAELDEAKKQLEDRQIRIEKAGSIADAALDLYGLFTTAQKAADDYVDSIKAANSDREKKIAQTEAECERMRALAEREVAAQRAKVEAECSEKLADAEKKVEKRWQEFQDNVEEILKAHSELSGLLGKLRE